MRLRLWHAVGALLVSSLLPADAAACSCMSSGPPCQATWSVDAVFSGIVRSIDRIDHPQPGSDYAYVRVRFEVERPFRNVAAGSVDVETAPEEAACGYDFKVGKRYLVYARRNSASKLTTSICSRTRPIEKAEEDLQYLASIPATGGGARIYGRITQYERDPGDDRAVGYGPVEGLIVAARGTAFTLEANTDKNGRYEITGVPPGKVTVVVIPPPRFSRRYLQQEIDVKDLRACAELDFMVRYDGRIAGTVLDASGQPASGVNIEAIAAEDATAPRTTSHPKVKTDPAGRYEFVELSPGSYVVGVNLAEPPALDTPYPATFFPGATEPARATAIELSAGEHKELAPFRLGERLSEISLNGCVVWPDGQPVAEVLVVLRHAGPRMSQAAPAIPTDGRGCFSFRVLRDVRYTLSTFATTPGGPGNQFKAEQTISVSAVPSAIRLVLRPTR